MSSPFISLPCDLKSCMAHSSNVPAQFDSWVAAESVTDAGVDLIDLCAFDADLGFSKTSQVTHLVGPMSAHVGPVLIAWSVQSD